MPPNARPEKEKRLKAILAFAAEVESQLTAAAASKAPTALSQELEKQIATFPNVFAPSSSIRCDEIDAAGIAIWNLCTRLRREFEVEKPQDAPFVLIQARVFAFLLLDCAYQTGKSGNSNILRFMKTGIKASKSCLDHKKNDLALKVLEKMALYEDSLKQTEGNVEQNDTQESDKLLAEFYVIRTVLAWQTDQLQIAEVMYKKATASKKYLDPHTAEQMADVLYEMGKELFHKQQDQMSVKWLERAYSILESQELDKLSMDACELRISIIQMSVKALLVIKKPETTERAQGLIKLLESEIGDKLIVLLLKLECISSTEGELFDSNMYHNILQRMVRTVSLNESNFRLIMFHVKVLKEKSPSLASSILEDLLNLRLLEEGKEEWIEKTVIIRLWILTSQQDSMDALHTLHNALSFLASNLKHPLRPAAAHAAHMLFWKKIEASYAQEQYDLAEKWCKLALHEIFGTSGDVNIGRISRKLLLCALAKKNLGGARDIFESMSETAKNEPTTRFLMYKVATRCNDIELAAACLSVVSAASSKDPSLMFACCLDAQQVGNKEQMLHALQLILDTHIQKPSLKVHLPSLVRLAIGLMETLIEEHAESGRISDVQSTSEKMCIAFEQGSVALKKSRSHGRVADDPWSIDELDWFSKNSYNIAIKHLPLWHPRQSLRMLLSCITFIDCYPKDIGEQTSEDLTLRKMFCEFSAATALAALARGQDSIETRLQDYLSLRKHVDKFDTLLQEKVEKLDEDARHDLQRKLSILAAFDFEAACQLKDWNSLSDAIAKADTCKNSQVYEVMADCILCSDAPTKILITTLKTIVNEIWRHDEHNIAKLAKYMRCLFQITLSDNLELAEQLLIQISSGAGRQAGTELAYPTEELEWVATKAFNQAVDLFCAGEDDSCRVWVAHALKVAHCCTDGGGLERLLHKKLAGLQLGPG